MAAQAAFRSLPPPSPDDDAFPSCTLLLYDMSDRRLRHVNAEKLEEWKAEVEDWRLEKLAEQFLWKKAKMVKKNSTFEVEKYLDKYREEAAKFMEELEESVRLSFELYKDNKRKILPSSGPSKCLKICLGHSRW